MRNPILINVMFLGFAIVATGCSGVPERAVQKRLTQKLAVHGYSVFQPFRSDDMPGTIFVFTRNHEGRKTEFTLTPWQDTFAAEPQEIFPQAGQALGAEEKIVENTEIGGDLALSLIKPVARIGLNASHIKKASIELGSDQRKFVLDHGRLGALRDSLKDNTRRALEFYKSRDELDNCYLIMETYKVDSLNLSIEFDSTAAMDLAIEKLKPVASATLKVSRKSDRSMVLGLSEPRLIGFKALKIKDSMLATVTVKPPIEKEFLQPFEVDIIRR